MMDYSDLQKITHYNSVSQCSLKKQLLPD